MMTQENIPYTADEIKAMVKTIEELRRKYNKALERAREIHRNEDEKRHDMEWLFPELADGEDEKIRKEIIAFLYSKNGYMTPNEDWDFHNRWLAWLEKQGEQKPTDNKERLGLLKFIRKETGCGLAEANNALLKLIKVLKQHPLLIMDKPYKLKIEWEEQQ